MPTQPTVERVFHLSNLAANSNKVWCIRAWPGGEVETIYGRVGNPLQGEGKRQLRPAGFADRKIREQMREGYRELPGVTIAQIAQAMGQAKAQVAAGNGGALVVPAMLTPQRLRAAQDALEALGRATTDAARLSAAQALCDAVPLVLPAHIDAPVLARAMQRNVGVYRGMLRALGALPAQAPPAPTPRQPRPERAILALETHAAPTTVIGIFMPIILS